MAEAAGFDGPMAEFVALRQEIMDRIKAQHQFLALQLTITGAIFAFAISQAGRTTFLLAIPFSSYMIFGRLAAQHFGTLQAAKYIREELSDRIPGGLRWEEWTLRNGRGPRMLGSVIPLFLTFVGASLVAVLWIAAHLIKSLGSYDLAHVGIFAVWLVGVAATCLTGLVLTKVARAKQL